MRARYPANVIRDQIRVIGDLNCLYICTSPGAELGGNEQSSTCVFLIGSFCLHGSIFNEAFNSMSDLISSDRRHRQFGAMGKSLDFFVYENWRL